MRRSFTLTEIIIALAAFLVAVAPLLGLLLSSSKVNVDNTQKIRASMLANRELERLRQLAWSDNWETLDLTRPLGPDAEFGTLSYMIEHAVIRGNATTSIAHAFYIGIMENGQVNKAAGSGLNASAGSNATGLDIGTAAVQKFANGGHLCVNNETIFRFSRATADSILGLQRDDSPSSASGNAFFLDHVFTLTVSRQK